MTEEDKKKETKEQDEISAADLVILDLAKLYNQEFEVTLRCVPDEKTNKIDIKLVTSYRGE